MNLLKDRKFQLVLAISMLTSVANANFLRCYSSQREFIGIACLQSESGCPSPNPECVRHVVTDYTCAGLGFGCSLTFGTLTGQRWVIPCVTTAVGTCACPELSGPPTEEYNDAGYSC